MSRVSRANIANSHWLSPNLISHLIPSDGTKGEAALLEVAVRTGGELPLRTHVREDQFFYVLEGNFVFDVGGIQTVATKGSFVWVPKGVEHGFRVYLDGGRVLHGLLPGGFERWLLELSSPAEFLNLPPHDLPSYLLNIAGMVRATRDYGVIFGSPKITVTYSDPIAFSHPFANHRSDRRSLNFGPIKVSQIACPYQTDGALTGIEVDLEPQASSPLSTKSEVELVYILEGQARYQICETLIEVGAGTALLISRETASGYRNIGEDRLRALHLVCGSNEEAVPLWSERFGIAKVLASHGWNWIAREICD